MNLNESNRTDMTLSIYICWGFRISFKLLSFISFIQLALAEKQRLVFARRTSWLKFDS